MARFGNFDQYLDNAGDPLVEGKLYFYESGTTTPKTTYSDINNSIPNTNPVLLSAAGRQPNIFFDGVAKVILTDNNDVQIAVRDPVGETATDFGDEWVASKIYSSNDVVLGSDGIYYRSLSNGNQNNNPVTSSGFWTLLYSVEWNSGITYDVGAVVTYNNQQYQSLQASNIGNNPVSATTYWTPLNFAWVASATYSLDQNVVGTDGILYTSLQNSNTGNDPATSPAYWVGTSAAAAASATAAAASATAASASETAAAASETAAAASETAAAASESAAATSATNAATSASAASTSASNAATSETNAAASATAAASSATAASTSETNAAASASAASTSETNAAASATAAASSETAAASSASAASTSETNAAASASAASTSASNASTSETNAASSATSAASSATAAAGSATSAATSATDAAAKYDEFDDRYLGEKASDPTTDNDGNPLITGALYFNNVSDAMKVYDGAAWVNVAPVATSVTVSQISDYTGTATTLNYTSNLSSDAQTQLDAKAVYPTQTGNAGKYLTTDGSVASWGEVSASPTISATASGALANGDKVILNSDGTVSAIEAATSSAVQFESGSAQYNNVVYDSTNAKIVIVYRDGSNSNYGTAVVGTVSGTSISFGTPVVYKSGSTNYNSADYDSTNGKIVIAYTDLSNGDGVAVVGTVSGTSISFGTETVFLTPNLNQYNAVTFDSNAGKVLISYQDSDAQEGQSIVGTVSGTSISFGTAATFESARPFGVLSAFDSSANKILIIYRDQLNSFYATAVVATISGTSVSFGTPVVFNSVNSPTLGITFDSNVNKFLVSYKNGSDNLGYAAVGTISGTSVSFGTASAYTTGIINGSDQHNLTFDSNVNKCVLLYASSDNSYYPAFRTATISGTSVSFGTAIPSQSDSQGTYFGVGFDSTQNRVVGAFRNSTGVEGRSYVYDPSVTAILNTDNFLGISDGAYADAATATIQLVGSVDDAQTGLTAGVKYYVEKDGSLGTDTNQPYAGLGVSSTEILIKG